MEFELKEPFSSGETQAIEVGSTFTLQPGGTIATVFQGVNNREQKTVEFVLTQAEKNILTSFLNGVFSARNII